MDTWPEKFLGPFYFSPSPNKVNRSQCLTSPFGDLGSVKKYVQIILE